MEYTVKELAELSGLTARTLRYYDQIGLLKPARAGSGDYRVYGGKEVDILQQILFYRELGFALGEIKNILRHPGHDRESALQSHLDALLQKRERIEALIGTVKKTIASVKGDVDMKDTEKFEGFKKELIDRNEREYGTEIREKYGDEEVDASNEALMGLSKERYEEGQRLSAQINETLKAAVESGDPAGQIAQKTCELHREWLRIYYPKYSREYHLGLASMYVEDERFKAYYESIVPGGAEFLCAAIRVFCGE